MPSTECSGYKQPYANICCAIGDDTDNLGPRNSSYHKAGDHGKYLDDEIRSEMHQKFLFNHTKLQNKAKCLSFDLGSKTNMPHYIFDGFR